MRLLLQDVLLDKKLLFVPSVAQELLLGVLHGELHLPVLDAHGARVLLEAAGGLAGVDQTQATTVAEAGPYASGRLRHAGCIMKSRQVRLAPDAGRPSRTEHPER
jgi:hypothetical protein